jgi:hypothetical protein
MKIDHGENLIHRYLLGELTETDQTAFEQELLTDRDKFDRVWSIENELIDSYVRGEMSGAKRERFESHYMASSLHRERVAIARLFLENIDQQAAENYEVDEPAALRWGKIPAPRRSLQPAFILVLAFLLTIGAAWVLLERARLTEQIAQLQNETQAERLSLKQREEQLSSRNRELENEIANGRRRGEQLTAELEQLRRESRTRPSAIFSYLLKPSLLRSENATPPPTIRLSTGKVRLMMQLGSKDHQGYRVKLQTVEGREISLRGTDKTVSVMAWSDAALIPAQTAVKDAYTAEMTIPVEKLAKGEYVVILFGISAGGSSEEIDRYFFRAQ